MPTAQIFIDVQSDVIGAALPEFKTPTTGFQRHIGLAVIVAVVFMVAGKKEQLNKTGKKKLDTGKFNFKRKTFTATGRVLKFNKTYLCRCVSRRVLVSTVSTAAALELASPAAPLSNFAALKNNKRYFLKCQANDLR